MTMAENKEKKVLNVPNLRFPEFEGEWEENYVNEICNEFKSGKAIKADLILDVGTYPVFGGNGLRGYTSTYNHDGLFVLIGRQGALCGNVRSVIGKTYITEHAIAVNGNNKSDTNFLHYLFLQMDLGRFSDQSAQPGLAVNKLLKLKVITPRIDEQRKIANLLRLLDERIATQNKIIEDLKKLKSAISKYLFERKDLFENKIKLSKVAELKNGYAFQSSKYNALGKWKILTIANVAGERYVKTNECNSIIEIPYDIQKHQKLEANDILISLTGNVGRVSLCTEGFFLLNQRVGLLQLKVSEDREYIYQALSSHKFENSMIACAQGAAQMNIGKGDVENYILPYSFNKENINSVASVLKNYDKYIINEINMLSMLHSQKQYLLRQMFI